MLAVSLDASFTDDSTLKEKAQHLRTLRNGNCRNFIEGKRVLVYVRRKKAMIEE
jgi:hypothetical protein